MIYLCNNKKKLCNLSFSKLKPQLCREKFAVISVPLLRGKVVFILFIKEIVSTEDTAAPFTNIKKILWKIRKGSSGTFLEDGILSTCLWVAWSLREPPLGLGVSLDPPGWGSRGKRLWSFYKFSNRFRHILLLIKIFYWESIMLEL